MTVEQFMSGIKPNFRPWTQQEKDRAQRAADTINELRQGLDWETLKQCWMAFKLSDGSSDGILYDSQATAIRHQLHEKQCVYISMKNLIQGASAKELLRFFRFNEDAYDGGYRLPDPDSQKEGVAEIIPTTEVMDPYFGKQRPTL